MRNKLTDFLSPPLFGIDEDANRAARYLNVILLAAIFLLVFKLKKRKEAIPFGPFLAIGAIVTLIWGSQILHWYLGLFRF